MARTPTSHSSQEISLAYFQINTFFFNYLGFASINFLVHLVILPIAPLTLFKLHAPSHPPTYVSRQQMGWKINVCVTLHHLVTCMSTYKRTNRLQFLPSRSKIEKQIPPVYIFPLLWFLHINSHEQVQHCCCILHKIKITLLIQAVVVVDTSHCVIYKIHLCT